ncbi:hypothetical protein BVX97_01190 [bacterium E08(2017)]|nr:hypothetical protein BVX97_01190 [bacterium E08(2017)]
MSIPITRKTLLDWGGQQALRDAQSLVDNGQVLEAEYIPPHIKGSILHNNRALETSCEILPDNSIENQCPCYTNKERGLVCPHILALGLSLVARNTDPMREAKYQEEKRRAERIETISDDDYIRRLKPGSPGAIPASLVIGVTSDFPNADSDKVGITCSIEYRNQVVPANDVPRDVDFTFSEKDEALLFVLEDIANGPIPNVVNVGHADFINIVRLARAKNLAQPSGKPITINDIKLKTMLNLDLDRETGEIILIAHTELPFLLPGEFPIYFVSGKKGIVYGADNIWQLENVLPLPYHSIYKEPVIIARKNVVQFFQRELPELSKTVPLNSDLSFDLFTIDPARPQFEVMIKGSPASLSAKLIARYNGFDLIANKPDSREHFAIPDPTDMLRFTVRNKLSEKKALATLKSTGMVGECGDDLTSIIGKREVLNFIGTHLPSLRRNGWKISVEGRVTQFMEELDHVIPVVHVLDGEDDKWFDIGFDFENADGSSISASEIQTAIRKGDSFIEHSGKTYLIDTDAISDMQSVFSDCNSTESSRAGYFRLSSIYSSFVKSSLDSLDGIDIEHTEKWRQNAEMYNRNAKLEPVELTGNLGEILRPYQKQGVSWLRFLESSGFCGLLADEMGLGKTIQTLAWLELERLNPVAQGKPSLIICPTSLVENWAEEANRFTPSQKTIILTGADRQERWDQIPSSNIAVTSYAILRRDIEQYMNHEFSTVVLDEAQHIKNKSTQNARAAKKINAYNKLVLTGTPIENSVSDLWSIMDFLMPDYLSSHENFRHNYEIPIARGDRLGELAKTKLRRKLHPFLLRRLKRDVAKDLPDKIQRISSCSLSADQQAVYNELLKQSRAKFASLSADDNFGRNRIEILTILMRLRQVCCHLDLLNMDNLSPKIPSAKMDLFFELVDEAMDSGHRILVFSQFVSMLTILSDELKKRGITYCYLDGSTKDRQGEVRKFNTERDIPLFLISLKAGGTGLNLTGADMVIHFDPWWNPAVEDQATDRAHRIGQKKTVYSIKMITRNTIEEKVLNMQKKKQAVIDATIVSDENYIQSLTMEDIADLLEV